MSNPSNPAPLAPTSLAQKPSRQLSPAKLALFTALTVAGCLAPKQAPAQTPAPAGFEWGKLPPVLTDVQNAITSANVAHWKVPGATKANTQQDVASMQRDMSTTLPPLISAAATAPVPNATPTLAPAFAVFRNLDALYDVLLRVSQVANAGAPAPESDSLESARAALETSRASLGSWLLEAIGAQDSQLAQAVAAAAARPPAPPPPPTKIVVEDGPETPKPRKKKAQPTPAPQ